MASIELSDLSIYAKNLTREDRERYMQKLTCQKTGTKVPDPFTLDTKMWLNDPCLWPEVEFAQIFMYLIETPARFSPSTMKAYKSLKAYK